MIISTGIDAIIGKLRAIERATSSEKGDYKLFGLFLREDSLDKWDLLVAADWIRTDDPEPVEYISSKIQKSLTPYEIVSLSRVLLIPEDNPGLIALQQGFSVEGGSVEIKNSTILGLQIKHAYIITCRR